MTSQFVFTRHIKKTYYFFEQKSLCFKDNLVAVARQQYASTTFAKHINKHFLTKMTERILQKRVNTKSLEEYFNICSKFLENYCGICWMCIKRIFILDEFKKKGFHSFNSDVNEWKLIEDLISFKIFPFDDLKKNECTKCQIF